MLAESSRAVEECLISLTSCSRLSMIGLRVPLAPVKPSTIMIDVSDTVTLSCKSVSKMEIERIASSKVFGIFWASAM